MKSNDLPEEWSNYSREGLLADLEVLREAGLIDVVGINGDGEWLYGLSEKAQKIINDDQTGDPWATLSQLLDELANKEDTVD